MSRWLLIASAYQETFYGLLARRALGMETRFDFRPHTATAAGLARIAGEPAGAPGARPDPGRPGRARRAGAAAPQGLGRPGYHGDPAGAGRAWQAAATRLQAGEPTGKPTPCQRRRPPGGRALPAPAVAAGQRLQGRPRPGLCPDAPGIGLQPQGQEPGRRARPDAAHAGDRQLTSATSAIAENNGTGCSTRGSTWSSVSAT